MAGLHTIRITLDNPKQHNSYTTDMVKGVFLAFRAASNARDVNCVVFTCVGDKAFCTGGNTKEYAEYYAARPQEYRQYMRLFNDMVSGILTCDKPVICRVNGMRIGGQETFENLEDDDLLEMANPGLVKITVVDNYIGNFWKQVFTNLTVHDSVTLRTDYDSRSRSAREARRSRLD